MTSATLDLYCVRAKNAGCAVLYVPPKPRPTGHPNEAPYTFAMMAAPPTVKT